MVLISDLALHMEMYCSIMTKSLTHQLQRKSYSDIPWTYITRKHDNHEGQSNSTQPHRTCRRDGQKDGHATPRMKGD